MAMLKIEIDPCSVIAVLLIATLAVADVSRELKRCELEAGRLYPAPHNKGVENWPEREANLQKRAEATEKRMQAAGYSLKAECSIPSRPMKAV
jgi:hypothetical protein